MEDEMEEHICKNCNHPIEPIDGGWMHELEALNEDGTLGGCLVMQRYVVGECGCTNPEPVDASNTNGIHPSKPTENKGGENVTWNLRGDW